MRGGERLMEPNEIFGLIVKADERLKYAKGENADLRSAQARELLERALEDDDPVGIQGGGPHALACAALLPGLVYAHGGEIWASSPGPGQGSIFRFTLPVYERSFK